MPADAMVATLQTLDLFGMAEAVEELATQGSPAYHQAEAILANIPKAEVVHREVRSVNYQMSRRTRAATGIAPRTDHPVPQVSLNPVYSHRGVEGFSAPIRSCSSTWCRIWA